MANRSVLDAQADQLRQRLDASRDAKKLVHEHRRGRAPLRGVYGELDTQFASEWDRRQYREFINMSKLNMCPLIVDSIVDDVELVSFSEVLDEEAVTPTTNQMEDVEEGPEEGSEEGSDEPIDVASTSRKALRRMKSLHLTAKASRIFADELHHGVGYGYVDEDSEDGNILHVDSRHVYVETDPLDPWNRKAAIVETYQDETDDNEGTLVQRLVFIKDADTGVIHKILYRFVDDFGFPLQKEEVEYDTLKKLKVIPVVPAVTPEGVGIYEPHLATIDRINFMIFSRLVITDKQSFKELWIKGLPAFVQNPDTGEYQAIDWSEHLLRGPGNANLLPGDNADVKETGVTDFTPLTGAVFSEIKHLAALTSTPLYILDPSSAQQSALGADLADKVHRTKVRTLRSSLEDCVTELMALSFEVTGDSGKVFEAEWAPMEDESMSARAQTASMVRTLLPYEFIWTDILKLDPEQVESARQAIATEMETETGLIYSAHADKIIQLREQAAAGEDQLMLSSELVAGENIEETPEPSILGYSEVENPEDAADPSNFIIVYLQDHGGVAKAREVIRAGQKRGLQENAIKTARTRISNLVRTERKTEAGKSVNYWYLNQARQRVGTNG